MLQLLRFAFSYAFRNLRRDRQRTLFALISIAAGVSTVVALRALGLMLTDALTANAQATLRGDVYVGSRGSFQVAAFGSGSRSTQPVDSSNYQRILNWAQSRGFEVNFAMTSELMQIAIVREVDGQLRAERPAFVTGQFIDPQRYPFYDIIRAETPAHVPLKDLFTADNQVVVAKRVADELNIKVGDQVRVGTAQELQTVTGIMPDAVESSLTNPNSFLFSFVYLDRAALAKFGLDPNAANEVYLKLPEGTDQAQVVQQIRNDWQPFWRTSYNTDTAERTLRRNRIIADAIARFVLILSLVGLVIGGVGIINTMWVNVNRRSGEIAVLKTLGLKGWQVSAVFFAEALIAGFLGSVLGVGLGVVLSALARNFGEQAFGVALPFRLYLDPMLIGVALGVTITVFFAFLPTLMAGRVRPIWVLRAGAIPMARAGCIPSLISMVVLTLGLGGLVDVIISSNRLNDAFIRNTGISPGILGVTLTFFLLGVVIAIMWLIVWLLGKIPSFRNPNLRLAVRGLTQHRLRTSMSLMALLIGMTTLSGTLIMARSINLLLYTSLSEPLGGNMIVLPLLPVQALVRAQLDSSADQVNGYREVRFAASQLRAIDGVNVQNYQPQASGQLSDSDQTVAEEQLVWARLNIIIGMNVYGNPKRGQLVAGRYLTPEDNGKNVIVIPYEQRLAEIGVQVGSKFTYEIRDLNGGSTSQVYEVVGLVAPDERSGLIPFSLGDSAVQAPLASVNAVAPFDLIIADVPSDSLNEVMGKVGAVPGLFVFDISLFDSIINRLLTQLAALPILIAVLSLFAAAALIATTVSLSTLERRRQIGVLKAVGVKRREVLGQLLTENGLIGFIGGVLSLLPTLVILALVPSLTENLVRLPVPWDLILLMMVTSLAVTVLATLLTAAPAASESPLAVLRYE